MEADAAVWGIRDIKCYDEGEYWRLAFPWPSGISQVYIFKMPGDPGASFNVKHAGAGQLYTLQEYKKLSGYRDRKVPGVYSYYICPFVRENGEDVYFAQTDGCNRVCLTGLVNIRYTLREKWMPVISDRTYEITLAADHPVEANVICYVKKENSLPVCSKDGILYYFNEPIIPGRDFIRHVRTGRNEYLGVFIHDEEHALYNLCNC